MSTTDLLKPILDGGIRSTHFFNGRLLSGEDLTTEQKASREARRQLGKAIGEGIAYGLEVSEATGASTKAAPVVTIKAGLAINRKGQTLMLPADADIALIRGSNANGTTAAVGFGDCTPPEGGVYIAGDGVYLLTIGPASGTEGRAPVSGLANITAACNTRYKVEGVRFRLLQLPLTNAELNDENHLRNLVAYKCFGVAETKTVLSNPFGPAVEKYGLLNTLRPTHLTDCEVPLAVIHWTTSGGIKFIDLWAVRRRLMQPVAASDWSLLLEDRRRREAEARFLQFQEQIDDIRVKETNLAAIEARQRFYFLPPVGIIPIGTTRARGFDTILFFQNLTTRKTVFSEGARVEPLLREALSYPPIDLASGEMIWLYVVHENMKAIDRSSLTRPQPYMIFTHGHISYQGQARFDLAHWNYANYSLATV